MPDVPPDYIAELYRQIAFISAVFGGFAAAFLGTLLASASEQRLGTYAVGFAAAAAVLFIVGTIGSTFTLLDVLRLDIQAFDAATWPGSTLRTKIVADLSSVLGMYALILAVGLSGWTRSRATGQVTAAVAAVGVVLLSVALSAAF